MTRAPEPNKQCLHPNPLISARGFIFDMDDLLIHSKQMWRRAVASLLAAYQVPEQTAEKIHYRGLSAKDTARLIYESSGLCSCMDEFQATFTQCLLDEVKNRPAVALTGAIESVRSASQSGPVAVASGSPLSVIQCVLRQIGLDAAVDVVVSSDEVYAGKPKPFIFIEAAKRLEVEPRLCVVFEDSLVGVQAALAAGMRCIAVPSEMEYEIGRLTPYVYQGLDALPWADERHGE